MSRATNRTLFAFAAVAAMALALAGCANSARLAFSEKSAPPEGTTRSSLGQQTTDGRLAHAGPHATPPGEYRWNGSPARHIEGTAPLSAPPATRGPGEAPPRVVAVPAPAVAAKPGHQLSPTQPQRKLTHGMIEVQPGDTLYALSRKHGVSISALMDTNQLKSLTLVPGQVLKLPPQSRPRG